MAIQIRPNLSNSMAGTVRVHDALRQAFTGFIASAKTLADPQWAPMSGVTISPAPDGLSFTAAFQVVEVSFHYVAQIDEKQTVRGKTVCLLRKPRFSNEPILLGAFTFDRVAESDMMIAGNPDQLDMSASGGLIVLHFIDAALRHPQP